MKSHGPAHPRRVELNGTVTQFMHWLGGTWTELQLQVSQELRTWTKFFRKRTCTTLEITKEFRIERAASCTIIYFPICNISGGWSYTTSNNPGESASDIFLGLIELFRFLILDWERFPFLAQIHIRWWEEHCSGKLGKALPLFWILCLWGKH